MFVLSFDVATKSLATSLIEYDVNYIKKINKIIREFHKNKKAIFCLHDIINKKLNTKFLWPDLKLKYVNLFLDLLHKITTILKNKIKILYLDVKDLIPGKKVSETSIVERTQKLKEYLAEIENHTNKIIPSVQFPLNVLIEYQMGPNDKSRTISSQIMYHFSNISNLGNSREHNIYLVGPTLKNQIWIGDEKGKYCEFVAKYKTNYSANKAHAKFNFLRLLNILGASDLIKTIKKKNIDDIADSTLMSLSWTILNYDI